MVLKKKWSLPYSTLGALLVRRQRDADAEKVFREALNVDPKDALALRMLSDIRLRANDAKEALEFAKRATALPDAPASAWIGLAPAEKATAAQTAASIKL